MTPHDASQIRSRYIITVTDPSGTILRNVQAALAASPRQSIPARPDDLTRQQIQKVQTAVNGGATFPGSPPPGYLLAELLPQWELVRANGGPGEYGPGPVMHFSKEEAEEIISQHRGERPLILVPIPGAWMMGVSEPQKIERIMALARTETQEIQEQSRRAKRRVNVELQEDLMAAATGSGCKNCTHPREKHGTMFQGRKCLIPGCKCREYTEKATVAEMLGQPGRLPSHTPKPPSAPASSKALPDRRRTVVVDRDNVPQPKPAPKRDQNAPVSAQDLINQTIQRKKGGT